MKIILATLLLVMCLVGDASAQTDCAQAPPSSRWFLFSPNTGDWRFHDFCSGASRQGVGLVTRKGHVWTIQGDALLAIWDDRNRRGLAAVFGREGSDQWQPVKARFIRVGFRRPQ